MVHPDFRKWRISKVRSAGGKENPQPKKAVGILFKNISDSHEFKHP